MASGGWCCHASPSYSSCSTGSVSSAVPAAVEVIIEASVVVNDNLLVVFARIDPAKPARDFLVLNLNTRAVDFNFDLVSSCISAASGIWISSAAD